MGLAKRTVPSKICPQCKKVFRGQRQTSQFCSRKCGYKSKKGKPLSKERKKIIRDSMAKLEVREKLRILNHRPRAPQSLEHRKKTSDRLSGKMPVNLARAGRFGNIQRGWFRVNGRRMFFKSKWKANYALYLAFLKKQRQIKNWQYEPDVFIFHKIQFGTRSYRPDFKVTNSFGDIEYHEVKGWMDAQSKTKLRRMAKYYPKIKIVLIDSTKMKELSKWKSLLKFY